MATFSYITHDDGTGVLELTGEVTVAQVRELHTALCADGRGASVLQVHCNALTRLDAAAVQVLFAAGRHAAEARVIAPSPAWANAFVRYGLADPFLPSR